MPLSIETFRNDTGGNFAYKALSHPLAAEPARALAAQLAATGPIAIYDPEAIAAVFDAFYSLKGTDLEGYFVQKIEHLDRRFHDRAAEPVTAASRARTLLIASFDPAKPLRQIAHLLAPDCRIFSFEGLKLPAGMLTDPQRYLSPLNFATNFALFRDAEGQHTRLTTSHYWSRYGAGAVKLWCRLFGAKGDVLATWSETFAKPEQSIVIDSRAVRERFRLGDFNGQLFVHAIGVAGHDVVKYALDVFGAPGNPALSATHDANAWPSERYAGLPPPSEDGDVVLWVQNSHPAPIPAGDIGLGIMGSDAIATLAEEIAPFASRALHVHELLPEVRWPAQIEIHAGKYFVRPRYEVLSGAQNRDFVAHPNVERNDLKIDRQLAELGAFFGKGHILPAALLPPDRYRTFALPTPMSTAQTSLPVKALVYDATGKLVAEHRFGDLPREHRALLDVSALAASALGTGFGHFELVYDFAAGTCADGWLHALFRYENRSSGHRADTSFGSHIFNAPLTWRGEPQSYSGPPPGLSTRLFLRVGPAPFETFCHLIYPVSQSWLPHSTTLLTLRGTDGEEIASKSITIPASGSLLWRVREMFDRAHLAAAGPHPYVIVRDETCRLFGYHGLEAGEGRFSLDHMFGF